MTTETRFFALKSKKENVMDRGQNGFDNNNNNNNTSDAVQIVCSYAHYRSFVQLGIMCHLLCPHDGFIYTLLWWTRTHCIQFVNSGLV